MPVAKSASRKSASRKVARAQGVRQKDAGQSQTKIENFNFICIRCRGAQACARKKIEISKKRRGRSGISLALSLSLSMSNLWRETLIRSTVAKQQDDSWKIQVQEKINEMSLETAQQLFCVLTQGLRLAPVPEESDEHTLDDVNFILGYLAKRPAAEYAQVQKMLTLTAWQRTLDLAAEYKAFYFQMYERVK